MKMILDTDLVIKYITMPGALPCSFSFPVDSFSVLIINEKRRHQKDIKIMFVAGQGNLFSCVTNLSNNYVLCLPFPLCKM